MAEIRDREALEDWLQGKPVEFARVIALRGALRVLPLALSRNWWFDLTSVALRALFISWAAGTWHAKEMSRAARAAAASARAADDATAFTAPTAFAARAAAFAADAAAADAPTADAAYAAFAARAAYAAASATAAPIWENLSEDSTLLETTDDPQSLLRQPLWSGPAVEFISNSWRSMEAAMRANDETWSVWIEWYERRLAGQQLGWDVDPEKHEALCIGLATEGHGFWNRSSVKVNADIAGRVEAARLVKTRSIIIRNPEQFNAWISQTPAAFGKAVAIRLALRLLPVLASSAIIDDVAMLLFRSAYFSRMFAERPTDDLRAAAKASAKKLLDYVQSAIPASELDSVSQNFLALAFAGTAISRSDINADYLASANLAIGSIVASGAPRQLIWNAIEADVRWLESDNVNNTQTALSELLSRQLWVGEMDRWPEAGWISLTSRLRLRGEDWDIWTNWYDGFSLGGVSGFGLSRSEEIELADQFSLLKEDFWVREPATVNADIKATIDAVRLPSAVKIPAPKRAPLMPVIRDGRVALLPLAAISPVESAKEERRKSGFRALRDSVQDFEEAYPNLNHGGLKKSLERLAEALGDSVESLDAIRAAMAAERIQNYAMRADDLFLGGMAAEVVSLNTSLQLNLAHFEEVAAYRAEVRKDERASRDERVLELSLARYVSSHVALEDDTSRSLDRLLIDAEDAGEEAASHEDDLIWPGFRRSLSNIVAVAAQDAVKAHKSYGEDVAEAARKGHISGVEEGSKLLTKALICGLPAAGLTALLGYAGWAWLGPVLKLLGGG